MWSRRFRLPRALPEIPSDLAFFGGLNARAFQCVERFGALRIPRQPLQRSPHPDQRSGGKADAGAVREVHRDHLVAIAVSRMEKVPGVGEQVELAHPLALRRGALALHHVSQSAHLHAGAGVQRGTVVLAQ